MEKYWFPAEIPKVWSVKWQVLREWRQLKIRNNQLASPENLEKSVQFLEPEIEWQS